MRTCFDQFNWDYIYNTFILLKLDTSRSIIITLLRDFSKIVMYDRELRTLF